jgi:hypothetical protein
VDDLHAIALAALRAVIDEDPEYRMRRIMRWYSREFHTPLHVVEELPTEDVLQAFFECQFESLSEKRRLKRAAELTETDEERAEREEQARKEEDADEDFMSALAKKTGAEKLAAPAAKKTALKVKEVAPQPVMQAPTPDMPEIDMVFEDEGNLPPKET